MNAQLAAILKEKGREVISIDPGATIRRAAELLDRSGIGALLVKDGERPVGILSERDIVRRVVAKGRDSETVLVSEIMTREIVVLKHTASVDQAMAVVTAKRCRHLPVVDQGKVAGMVSSGDLMRFVTRERDYEIEQLVNFITGKYPG
ncbi:MAG: CBS domain-containing protein [Deltaproteobacteria bacterium]|nr:CBS domain-containing protein [Deltaproteobacteria bacterium]